MINYINRSPKILLFFNSWSEHILLKVTDYYYYNIKIDSDDAIWEFPSMLFQNSFYSKNGKCLSSVEPHVFMADIIIGESK